MSVKTAPTSGRMIDSLPPNLRLIGPTEATRVFTALLSLLLERKTEKVPSWSTFTAYAVAKANTSSTTVRPTRALHYLRARGVRSLWTEIRPRDPPSVRDFQTQEFRVTESGLLFVSYLETAATDVRAEAAGVITSKLLGLTTSRRGALKKKRRRSSAAAAAAAAAPPASRECANPEFSFYTHMDPSMFSSTYERRRTIADFLSAANVAVRALFEVFGDAVGNLADLVFVDSGTLCVHPAFVDLLEVSHARVVTLTYAASSPSRATKSNPTAALEDDFEDWTIHTRAGPLLIDVPSTATGHNDRGGVMYGCAPVPTLTDRL